MIPFGVEPRIADRLHSRYLLPLIRFAGYHGQSFPRVFSPSLFFERDLEHNFHLRSRLTTSVTLHGSIPPLAEPAIIHLVDSHQAVALQLLEITPATPHVVIFHK